MATQLPRTTRNRRYLFVAVTVAATITAAAFTADAQRRGEHFPIDIAAAKERAAERFAAVDSNEDGAVSVDEFVAAGPQREGVMRGLPRGPRGAGMDRRRGGKRDMERREAMRERRAAMEEGVFEQADGDGDGALSKDEYDGLPQARRQVAMQRTFERLDDDGDGVLSPEELAGRVSRLESLDADEDGKVTRREMRTGWQGREEQG